MKQYRSKHKVPKWRKCTRKEKGLLANGSTEDNCSYTLE